MEEPCVIFRSLFLFRIERNAFSPSTVKLSKHTELVWIWGIGVVGRPSASSDVMTPHILPDVIIQSLVPRLSLRWGIQSPLLNIFQIEDRILWLCNYGISGFMLLSFVIMCVCFPHAGYAVVSVDLVKNFLFCFCRYCVYGGQIVFPDKASLKHTSLIPALICDFQSKTRKPIINESTSTKEEWGQRWHIYREQLRNKSI